MAVDGQTWLEMAENAWKWLGMTGKLLELAVNVLTWL